MTDLMDEQLEAQLRIVRANDDKERMRMKRNLQLLKKTDDLDPAIFAIVESWLDVPLNEDGNSMTTDEVENIAHLYHLLREYWCWFLQLNNLSVSNPEATHFSTRC